MTGQSAEETIGAESAPVIDVWAPQRHTHSGPRRAPNRNDAPEGDRRPPRRDRPRQTEGGAATQGAPPALAANRAASMATSRASINPVSSALARATTIAGAAVRPAAASRSRRSASASPTRICPSPSSRRSRRSLRKRAKVEQVAAAIGAGVKFLPRKGRIRLPEPGFLLRRGNRLDCVGGVKLFLARTAQANRIGLEKTP